MLTDEIRAALFRLRDEKYQDFQAKLIPGMEPETMIGVRTPALRAYAKELAKRADVTAFLDALPHVYFDENQLHAFISRRRPSEKTARPCCRGSKNGSHRKRPTPCASGSGC